MMTKIEMRLTLRSFSSRFGFIKVKDSREQGSKRQRRSVALHGFELIYSFFKMMLFIIIFESPFYKDGL
jgi:carotenoid cleavage dioxygenase-like enzyme